MPPLPGGVISVVIGMSADGAWTVGRSQSPGPTGPLDEAVRWSAPGTPERLGSLAPGRFSEARGINGDGSVIVGTARDASGADRAFRWTAGGGMRSLGVAPADLFSQANAVSGDGRVVVGRGDPSNHAVVWTRPLGMVDLNVLLGSLGVNMTGWELRSADAVNFDGTVIAGYGEHSVPGFVTRAWVAVIPRVLACYANCDGSTAAPALSVSDFVCFTQRFAAGDPYANCDDSTQPPVLNVNDFVCFQMRFAAGCP